jgi:hypothetical protein
MSGKHGALASLVGLLGHPYPKIRKAVAEKFFAAMASVSEIYTALDSILEVLSTTQWDCEDEHAWRPAQHRIAELTGLAGAAIPVFTVPIDASAKSKGTGEIGYSDLVKETTGTF